MMSIRQIKIALQDCQCPRLSRATGIDVNVLYRLRNKPDVSCSLNTATALSAHFEARRAEIDRAGELDT
jgi:hypothetical protein